VTDYPAGQLTLPLRSLGDCPRRGDCPPFGILPTDAFQRRRDSTGHQPNHGRAPDRLDRERLDPGQAAASRCQGSAARSFPSTHQLTSCAAASGPNARQSRTQRGKSSQLEATRATSPGPRQRGKAGRVSGACEAVWRAGEGPSPGSRPGFLWDPRARARGFFGVPGLAPGVSLGSPGSRPGFLWDPRARARGFFGVPGLAPGVFIGRATHIETPGASQGTVRWSGENDPRKAWLQGTPKGDSPRGGDSPRRQTAAYRFAMSASVMHFTLPALPAWPNCTIRSAQTFFIASRDGLR